MQNIYLKPFLTFLFSGVLFIAAFAQGTYEHSNTTVTDTVGTLYDNGGPNDLYRDNTIETPFTIKPSNGKEVTIHFTEFNIETSEAGVGAACPYDYLEIYDGETADPLTLVGRFCGTVPPADFTSTSGAVTLLFFSDGGTELDGYEMLWNTGGPFPSGGGPTYCSGSGLPCVQAPNRTIFNVNIKTINNPSGCSATGYSDYTDSIAEVAPDENVDITVTTSGFGNPFHYMAAWVDWNQNGSFEELEKTELVGNGVAMDDFIGTIIVPTDAAPGLTRMRIRYSTDPALGNGTPCGDDTDGEVEDYGILVGTRMPCLSSTYPAHMDSVICLSDSTIYWDSVPDATNYNFSLQYDNGGSWVSVVDNENLADTFYFVSSGFLPGTHYKWIAVPNSASNAAFLCDTLEFYTAAEPNPLLTNDNREVLVCPGEPGDLIGTIKDGKPVITFEWFGEVSSLSRTDTATSTFTHNSPGLYGVKTLATDANGCRSDTIEYSIRVKPNPSFSALDFGDTTLCFGEEALVSVSGLNGTISFEYTTNPTWVGATSTDDGLGNYTFALPLDTLQVRGILELDGCRDTTATQLYENPNTPIQPDIQLTNATQSWCKNDSVYAFISNYENNLMWNSGEDTDSILVLFSGPFFAALEYANGACTIYSDTLDLTVNEHPVQQSIDHNKSFFCEGESLELVLNTSIDVSWSNNTTGDTTYVNQVGPIWAILTNTFNCSTNSDTLDITESSAPPQPDIYTVGTAPFCAGDEVSLGSLSPYTLLWSDGETTPERAVTTSGVYFVWAVSTVGCTTPSEEVNITFIDLPATPDVILVGVDSLSSTVAGTNYAWFKDGAAFGPDSRTIFVSEKGNYSVLVTNASGCVSEESIAFVYNGIGVGEILNLDFTVFPNPVGANGILQMSSEDDQRIIFYNQIGQEVRIVQLARGTNQIQLDLGPGVYLLKGEKEGTAPLRLILQ